jgi:hypothetical protein
VGCDGALLPVDADAAADQIVGLVDLGPERSLVGAHEILEDGLAHAPAVGDLVAGDGLTQLDEHCATCVSAELSLLTPVIAQVHRHAR